MVLSSSSEDMAEAMVVERVKLVSGSLPTEDVEAVEAEDRVGKEHYKH